MRRPDRSVVQWRVDNLGAVTSDGGMHPDLERVETLFGDAVDLPPAERAAYLDAHCAGDVALRGEVESLLVSADAVERAHTLDAEPPAFGGRLRSAMADAARAMLDDRAAPALGGRIGPYRVLLLIGESRTSRVYLAERDDARQRGLVWLEVLPTAASREALAHLGDERQLHESLRHPAIARLIDGGATEGGLLYRVREHIDGVPLARYARPLPVRERVALMRRVCDPIEYAHQHLVLHGNLKPSSVLVTADGAPKLLDFGVAALPPLAEASPARGGAATVANDVYALGAVLYRLLSDRPPAREQVVTGLRQDGEAWTEGHRTDVFDPPPPSTVAAPRHRNAIAGDLDNIAMRALRKDPAARYASVAALSDDLARYLDGRPVLASNPTCAYRARKLIGRHKGSLTLALAVLCALAAAAIM